MFFYCQTDLFYSASLNHNEKVEKEAKAHTALHVTSFSVLKQILRVGTSGWVMVTPSSVHITGGPSPWRESPPFRAPEMLL